MGVVKLSSTTKSNSNGNGNSNSNSNSNRIIVDDEYNWWWSWLGLVGLTVGMVVMEGCTVGLTIWTKTVMAKGLSPYVYVVYTNALASFILVPSFFIFHRPKRPYFTFKLINKFFLLGLIGIAMSQMLAFNGLSYSSPIVVATMSNLLPSISLILSFILRTRKLDLRSTNTQVKLVGTLISICGAVIVTLYKGPSVWSRAAELFFSTFTNNNNDNNQLLDHHLVFPSSSTLVPPKPKLFLYSSTPENWLLGSFLLAAATLCSSIWNLVQADTVKDYPDDIMTIVTFYSFFGTIQCGIVALIAERDLSAWKLTNNMEIINIILSAVFGSVIRSGVQVWCMRRKGPVFVAMFKPFTIFIAVMLGFLFFGNGLHIGSVIGAFIVAIGYYSVMWGQMKEEKMVNKFGYDSSSSSSGSSNPAKVPLLQDYDNNQDDHDQQMEV